MAVTVTVYEAGVVQVVQAILDRCTVGPHPAMSTAKQLANKRDAIK
jgi:hypothetical protein